ncbi:hypothetical protein PTR13_24505 [Serratia bockelmannii]|uniref:hypothetical protein n=1 Tax=Serratia TaxID=613 RepID=UPI00313C96C8
MRNIMIRKLKLLIALVVVGGIPLSGMCATETTVNISATVTKECTVAVDTRTVDLGTQTGFNTDKFTPRDVNVTTNCAGGKGKLTLLASETLGDNIVLSTDTPISGTNYTNKLKLQLSVNGEPKTFDSGKKIVRPVGQSSNVTKLTFRPVTGQNVIAGQYTGSLTITVEAV